MGIQNNIIDQNSNTEVDYAKYLQKEGLLPGPDICACNSKNFSIQIDKSNKTSGCIYRCSNYKCRKKFSIRTNSIYELFPFNSLKLILEIISCFLIKEFNVQKAHYYLQSEKNFVVSKNVISKIYKTLRNIIERYLYIIYNVEILGEENQNLYFSADECMFGHEFDEPVWILGIINNTNKDFRLEIANSRDTNTIKAFISRHVKKGNKICTDGWPSYDYLDEPDSDYIRYKHNHGQGDFGYGLESTSHIEGLWANLQAIIKNTYRVMPHGNLLKFIKEAEFKFKLRNLNDELKIKEIFNVYLFLKDVGELEKII